MDLARIGSLAVNLHGGKLNLTPIISSKVGFPEPDI